MSTALIGFLGVIVGALVSGGVQSVVGRVDRARDARSAARLLYMQLHEAQQAIEDLAVRRDWSEMITDWTSFGTAWDRHAEALAGVLGTREFMKVSSAFGCLASLARSRARDGESAWSVPDGTLELYRTTVQAAKRPILEHSFTRKEKKDGQHEGPLKTEVG